MEEAKANCEACQVNSDSKFDHCHTGNCLDETTDHMTLYCAQERSKVQVNDCMNVFDNVHTEMGVKPSFSKQLAKGALAWILNDEIVSKLHNTSIGDSPLMDIVSHVHDNIIDQ